jgi:hypothetical protein
MIRHLTTILLPVALFLLVPTPAKAQWRPPARSRWMSADIAGRYVFTGNDGECFVYRRGRNYLFVNERGAEATFAWVGPRTLQLVTGDEGWDPNISATVSRDSSGRRGIRFSTPSGPAGRWVQDD